MSRTLLQQHNLKATQPRLAVLQALQHSRQPLTVEALQRRLPDRVVSLATVYRTVVEFVRVGLANSSDLGHGHAHYEYADQRRHHHHVVCTDCGRIDTVKLPQEHALVQVIGRRTRYALQRHIIEFFGICPQCSAH